MILFLSFPRPINQLRFFPSFSVSPTKALCNERAADWKEKFRPLVSEGDQTA
jgi:hypothetical protein